MRAGGEGARCWYRAGCRSVAGSELLLHWDRRTPVAKKSATKKNKTDHPVVPSWQLDRLCIKVGHKTPEHRLSVKAPW